MPRIRTSFVSSAIALMACGTLPATAATLFADTLTGVEIQTDAATSFPDGDVTPNTNSVDLSPTRSGFSTGAGRIIMRWDLLSAAPRGDLTVSIDFDYDAVSFDNDLEFQIFDGTNFVGFGRRDDGNGRLSLLAGDRITALPDTSTVLSENLGVIDPFSFTLEIDAEGGPLAYSIQEGSSSVFSGTVSAPFNTSGSLSFILRNNDRSETYRLNEIEARVEAPEPIPVPASLPLLLAGAGALALLRRRT